MSSFSRALIASICLHSLVIGAYFALLSYEPAIKLSPIKIQLKLAKLGPERDKSLLPRLDVSEVPKPKPAPIHKKASPLDLLKKRFGKPTPQGQKHGSRQGSSLTSELADSYDLQVAAILRENYEIPRVISDKEARTLSMFIRIWIGQRGEIIKIKVEQASKNQRFDKAVIQGSEQISSFGAPPLQLARKYRTEGLLIQFCPLECQ
ncbi:MAG: TonB C-terminal domain-containing protein [Myxococcaceae bacterium]